MNLNKKFFNRQSFIGMFMIAFSIIAIEYRILNGEELNVRGLIVIFFIAIYLIVIGYRNNRDVD